MIKRIIKYLEITQSWPEISVEEYFGRQDSLLIIHLISNMESPC